jgi:hypothetical protein
MNKRPKIKSERYEKFFILVRRVCAGCAQGAQAVRRECAGCAQAVRRHCAGSVQGAHKVNLCGA